MQFRRYDLPKNKKDSITITGFLNSKNIKLYIKFINCINYNNNYNFITIHRNNIIKKYRKLC